MHDEIDTPKISEKLTYRESKQRANSKNTPNISGFSGKKFDFDTRPFV